MDIKSLIKSRRLSYRLACGFHTRYEYTRMGIEELVNRIRYDAPVRPLQLLRIDPKTIGARLNEPLDRTDFRARSPVIGGDWDRNTENIYEYDLFQSIYCHFKHGVAWEETDFFRRICEEIRTEDNWRKWSCESIEDMRTRLEEIDNLYAAIDEHGYLTQAELVARRVDPIGANR